MTVNDPIAVDRSRRRWLAVRTSMLAAIRDAIDRRLPDRPGAPVEARLIASAVVFAGDGASRIHCSAALAELVKDTGVEIALDAEGAAAMVELDGRCGAIDASLEGYLARAWPSLRSEALAAIEHPRNRRAQAISRVDPGADLSHMPASFGG